jgi:hypothetical protein
VNSYLPYFKQWLICHLLSAGFFRLCLLKVSKDSCPFPLLRGSGFSALYFSRPCLLKVQAAPCPSPLLLCAQSTLPSLLHVLFCSLLFSLFVFFVGWGSVCPGGYSGLSQGWLWEYFVPLICSPVGVRLPSTFGAGVWRRGSLPGFSV